MPRRDPSPTSAQPVTLHPSLVIDLTEAVSLSLLLRLEFHELVELPPGLGRLADRYVEWCPGAASRPEFGLAETLRPERLEL